jgi:hypothetical protein
MGKAKCAMGKAKCAMVKSEYAMGTNGPLAALSIT